MEVYMSRINLPIDVKEWLPVVVSGNWQKFVTQAFRATWNDIEWGDDWCVKVLALLAGIPYSDCRQLFIESRHMKVDSVNEAYDHVIDILAGNGDRETVHV